MNTFTPDTAAANAAFQAFQANATEQTKAFAEQFTAQISKFAAAQQSWLTHAAGEAQAQIKQATQNKDPIAAAQAMAAGVVPAAESAVKHAQVLWNLALDARNEVSSSQKAATEDIAAKSKAMFEQGLAKLPNQGEPVVGMLKTAFTNSNAALEQVSAQFVEAQVKFEANVNSAFEQLLKAIPAVAEKATEMSAQVTEQVKAAVAPAVAAATTAKKKAA